MHNAEGMPLAASELRAKLLANPPVVAPAPPFGVSLETVCEKPEGCEFPNCKCGGSGEPPAPDSEAPTQS